VANQSAISPFLGGCERPEKRHVMDLGTTMLARETERERERERERVCVCVCVRERDRVIDRQREGVCVRERESERERHRKNVTPATHSKDDGTRVHHARERVRDHARVDACASSGVRALSHGHVCLCAARLERGPVHV